MDELELLALVEQSTVHEVWEATLGAERVLVRRTTAPGKPRELDAFAVSLRSSKELVDHLVQDGKVQLVERRPDGRRLDDLRTTFHAPCPPDVACAFGLELIAALREDHELALEAEMHEALDARSVFVGRDGHFTICSLGFGWLVARLLCTPARSGAAQVRQLVEFLSPDLVASFERDDGPTMTLAGLEAVLLTRARAPSGAPALGAWLARSSPLARLLDLPPSAPPRRETARAMLLEEPGTEIAIRAPVGRASDAWTGESDTSSGASSFDAPADPALKSWVGRTIDGYRLERRIGSGTSGDVYYGKDVARGVECAVKVLQFAVDPRQRARLHREAQAAIRVRHPNLVQVFDCGEADGVPYLLMEYIAGSNLKEVLRREGPFDAARAARLLGMLAMALGAIHRSGTVHRDIKPANLLVRRDVAGEILKVTDFGLARIDSAELTRLTGGGALGTPRYMAPEQSTSPHDAGPAADMYSAGVILYEMIEGHPPFMAPSLAELLAEHAAAPPPPPRDAGGLGPIAMMLLAKDPSKRPSAEAIAQMLEATPESASASVTAPLAIRPATPVQHLAAPVESSASRPRAPDTPRILAIFAVFVGLLAPALRSGLTERELARSEPVPTQRLRVVAVPGEARLTAAPEAIGDPKTASEARGSTSDSAPPDSSAGEIRLPQQRPPKFRPLSMRSESRRSSGRAPAMPAPGWVASALALRGLGRGDLELAPDLAKLVAELERGSGSGPEQAQKMAALEEAIARFSIDREFLSAKLDRAFRRLQAGGDHAPSGRIEALESNYLELSSRLRRAASDRDLAVVRPGIEQLDRDVQELR